MMNWNEDIEFLSEQLSSVLQKLIEQGILQKEKVERAWGDKKELYIKRAKKYNVDEVDFYARFMFEYYLLKHVVSKSMLAFFTLVGLPWDSNPIYKEIVDSLYQYRVDENGKPDNVKRYDSQVTLLMIPRGTMKTTMFVCARASWLYIHHTKIDGWSPRIAIGHSTTEKAEDNLRLVKQFLNNELVQFLFEDILETRKDTAQQLLFIDKGDVKRKETHYSIITPRSQPEGFHYSYILYDDMVTEKNSDTPEMANMVKRGYRALFPLDDNMLPGGMRIELVGTAYSNISLYEELRQNDTVKKYIKPAWEDLPDGTRKYNFPERLDAEKLEQIRKLINNDSFFLSQYQMIPYDVTSTSLQLTEDLPSYEEPKDIVWNGVLCDPAISESNKKSEAVVLVVGIDKKGHIYVLEGWSHAGPTVFDLSEMILFYAKRYNADAIIIEKIAYQQSLIQVVEEKMRNGKWFSIIPHAHRTSKALHFRMFLEPLFKERRIHIAPHLTKLIGQITGEESGNDWVDTLSFLSSININDIVLAEQVKEHRQEIKRKRKIKREKITGFGW